jgi:drug/metabolite transporter (DMT)-like permease
VTFAFGILAALANAGQALISKGLATRFPARQLIGPLYLANSLVLLPAAPFVAWTWSGEILMLHAVSVALMVVSAISVWDMFDAGAASAATTALALSPIATTLGAAALAPDSFRPVQVVAAGIVTIGVLIGLRGAFAGIGRFGTGVRVVGVAAGNGLLTVCAHLLGDAGVGVVETYVVRTALAALLFMILIPPRDVPWSEAPRLALRSLVVTVYFVLVILGAQSGSPVVVQTLVATTPLVLLAYEAARDRALPPIRGLAASAIVIIGVAITVAP